MVTEKEGYCFVINVVSYLGVVVALLAMRLIPAKREIHHAPVLLGLREGVSYALGFTPIRTILLLIALLSFMGMSYAMLMPIFAAHILGGGPGALGLLRAAPGVGALAGALYMASRRSVLGLGRTIIVSVSVFAVALIGFSLSPVIWLSLPFLVLAGFGFMVTMAASNTILQTIVEENKQRPGDEPVHDGVCRRGAAGESVRRSFGHADWGATHGSDWRRRVCIGRTALRREAAASANTGSASLCQNGNSAGGGDGATVGDGIDGAARTVKGETPHDLDAPGRSCNHVGEARSEASEPAA